MSHGKVSETMFYPSSLTHTTLPHASVLKFVNKMVFFEEFQDALFPRKIGYFCTHLCKFGEKGVNFDVQMFYYEKEGSFGLKSLCFTTKKRDSFWIEKSVFYPEKGVVLS